MQLSDRHRQYWRLTQRRTALLLLVWLLVTFVLVYFARELRFTVFGWPFSFYMAAQGSLIVYLVIIYLYARRQRLLDIEYGVDETEEA